MKDLIEMRIIGAVRGLLVGRVNEILSKADYALPVIEFGDYKSGLTVAPVIVLSVCEQTEKERIIRLDAYSLTIALSMPETPEGELYCYAYSGAVGRAVYDDPTLGGVVDRAMITGRKYIVPKKQNCGEGWQLVISMRVTVENGQ